MKFTINDGCLFAGGKNITWTELKTKSISRTLETFKDIF